MRLANKVLGLVVAGATVAAGTAALADGMPSRGRAMAAPAPYSWAGFYAGVHVGYGTSDDPRIETSYLPSPQAFDGRPIQPNMHSTGFLGGLQAGYNWQFGQIVAGLEADISLANVEGTQSATFTTFAGALPSPASRHAYTQELDWIGTVRTRVGFTLTPTMLAYLTGGLAYGKTSHAATSTLAPGNPLATWTGSESSTKTGWVLGGGVEMALAMLGRNWTLKAEGLYYDLGDTTVTAARAQPVPGDTFFVTHRFQDTGYLLRAGLNYRF